MEMMTLLPALLDETREFQRAFFVTGATLSAVAVVGMSIVSLLGILYMTLAIAPNVTQRCSTALRERNVLSFFLGLPIFAGFAILGGGAVAANAPLLAGLDALAFLVSIVLGYSAAAEDIGRRIFWACGREGSRAAHLAGGWLAFAFGSLFPVIGWFVIFPYVTSSALGSLVVGTFSGRRAPAPAPEIEYPKE
jgi:hypothetical protein